MYLGTLRSSSLKSQKIQTQGYQKPLKYLRAPFPRHQKLSFPENENLVRTNVLIVLSMYTAFQRMSISKRALIKEGS